MCAGDVGLPCPPAYLLCSRDEPDEVSDRASRNRSEASSRVHLAPFTRGFARWWLCRAVGELDPGRGVVACLVPASHVPVDAGGDKASRHRATEKKMIEPQAGVAAPGVPEVIPEGIDPFVRMERAYSVGPALIDEAAIGKPDLGAEERVIDPTLRLVDVEFGRHDVEIAGEHHRHTAFQELGGVRGKTLEPSELVVELRPGCRIAVRQIEAADDDAGNCRLDIAALRVLGVARQPTPGLGRIGAPGEDCDAIPTLLAVPDRAVAGVTKGRRREPLLRRLQLLQADDVRRGLGEPAQEHRQTAVDAVDVEGSAPDSRLQSSAATGYALKGLADLY